MMKYKSSETKVWFASDLHYNHTNMVRSLSKWSPDSVMRDFKSLNEMNDAIVNGINKYVKQEDVLFLLGDIAFGAPENVKKVMSRINCDTIHFIYGNHDEWIEKSEDLQMCFTTLQDYCEVQIDDDKFVLFHYPIREWNGAHKGWYHLFGHVHTGLENKPWGRSIDVGLDNAFRLYGEYRPFSTKDILKELKNRPILKHH